MRNTDKVTEQLEQIRAQAARPERRQLLTLFGLFGGATVLDACGGKQAGLASASEAVLNSASTDGVDIKWVANVLGNPPQSPAVPRTGVLSTNDSTSLGASLVITEGCLSPGDGGAGVFIWSTGTDDGGTFIVPNGTGIGATGGGWQRIYEGPLDVKWFGAAGNGTNNDQPAIQAAINAAKNSPQAVIFSAGTYAVSTSGSTTTPVADALAISTSMTLVIAGNIIGTNNCNVFNISADNVTLVWEGGSVAGCGTYYQSGGDNGACIKWTGKNPRSIGKMLLVNPPQYGLLLRYGGADFYGGMIDSIEVIGGPGSLTSPQHYGVELEGPVQGLDLGFVSVRPSACGGACVQGLASGSFGAGSPLSCTFRGCNVRGTWDHPVYLACQNCTIGEFFGDSCGSEIRVIGPNNAAALLHNSNAAGGGISIESCAGSTYASVSAINCGGDLLYIGMYDTGFDHALSNIYVGVGTLLGTGKVQRGVYLNTAFNGTGFSHSNIQIRGGVIQGVAMLPIPAVQGGIEVLVLAGSTLSRSRIKDFTVDTTGHPGVYLHGEGTGVDFDLDSIFVRNPGSSPGEGGSSACAFVVENGFTWNGGNCVNCGAIDDRGMNAVMPYVFYRAGTVNNVKFSPSVASGYTPKGGVGIFGTLYTPGATTPNVNNVNYLEIQNPNPTTITNFIGAYPGQSLLLTFQDGNTTITRDNAYLSGAVNFVSSINATLTLVYDGTCWREVCRTTNSA
jgi:hypothetical protein